MVMDRHPHTLWVAATLEKKPTPLNQLKYINVLQTNNPTLGYTAQISFSLFQKQECINPFMVQYFSWQQEEGGKQSAITGGA